MAPNDTVERLAGGIAHDFDALLTAIIGHAENLSSDYLSPGDPRAVQVHAIRRAAERATDLTRQLLAFSRTQALRPTMVDVNAAVARAKHGLQRVLGERVVLEIAIESSVWPVHADAEQVDRILHHLAVSALGGMPDGGTIVVSTANVTFAPEEAELSGLEPGDYVELSMTDTGAEIHSTVQQRLFEPFFPAHERPAANGLGLAMVYGAVKQSGGHITVESPLNGTGQGSRFRVYLPAGRDSRRGEGNAATRTVLLFSDDRNVQSFIGAVLKRRGYRLVVAADPWEVLHRVEQEETPIDLLITMGINGAVVADAVQGRRPAMRVLHVSASADDAPERVRDAARCAILVQPFTPAALAKKVRALLS